MNKISKDKSWKYTNFIENKNYFFNKNQIFKVLSKNEIDDAYNVISNWEGYSLLQKRFDMVVSNVSQSSPGKTFFAEIFVDFL